MATLKRVGPGSAFKVGLVLYGILGLVIGVCMAFFSMMVSAVSSMAPSAALHTRALGFGFGLGAIIVVPILYGVLGGILGAIGAVIYNLVAGWVGGLEVDIS